MENPWMIHGPADATFPNAPPLARPSGALRRA